MFDDAALDWMAELDWSRHGRIGPQHLSKHMFMATVADIVGKAVCAPWPDIPFFLERARNPSPGPMVTADRAFDADGSPKAKVQDRLADLVRDHADSFDVPIASADRITYDEWRSVEASGAIAWSEGEGARRAAAGIAPLVAEMAAKGRITTWARPKGGGDDRATQIPADLWLVDPEIAIRRLASCGLNWDRPFDEEASVDRLIFVETAKLQNTIIEFARPNYVSIAFPEEGIRRDVDHYAVDVRAVATLLESLMPPERAHWRNLDFEAEVARQFTDRALGRVYERAKRVATSHPDRKMFSRPGPKPAG